MKITGNSQSQFINYVLDFYGQGGIYPLADPIINNKFVERDDVLKAFKKYKTLLDASIKLKKELKNCIIFVLVKFPSCFIQNYVLL